MIILFIMDFLEERLSLSMFRDFNLEFNLLFTLIIYLALLYAYKDHNFIKKKKLSFYSTHLR